MRGSLWTFRETGRQARLLRVVSSRDIDRAFFRFLDNDQTTRTVTVRRFLSDFVRAADVPNGVT